MDEVIKIIHYEPSKWIWNYLGLLDFVVAVLQVDTNLTHYKTLSRCPIYSFACKFYSF